MLLNLSFFEYRSCPIKYISSGFSSIHATKTDVGPEAYPVLIEVNEQRVAQAEHTFIPTENGVTITTIAL